jgi:pimeloyl-ACP methyl ester carboxylesterase
MPSLETPNGRTIAFHERGSGPPLVCHPGGPGFSSRSFGGLEALAARRTLLLLDPRGTGGSDRPERRDAYRLEDYAADLELLRAHLGLETLDLLGHSHGGFVAMQWAGTHADRVGTLVLASTAPRFSDEIRERRRQRVAAHAGQPYFDDAIHALTAHQEGRYTNDEELADLYRREAPLFAPFGGDTTFVGETLMRSGNNADALRFFNASVAGSMDLRPLLRNVTAPTLVLTGSLDPMGEPGSRESAALLPNARLHVLPNADHFPFLEPDQRDAWAEAVLAFLETGAP